MALHYGRRIIARTSPHRFVKDYLHVNLKLFQKILLFMMNRCNFFMYIASRGQGKSFLTAVFCVVRCILWPGSRVCIAAGNRGQSIVILEYVRDKLMPLSPELRAEIKDGPITTAANAYVTFKNGSTIKVVTAGDSARSNRATLLVVDEFRMVKESVIATVLRKFLTEIRHPGYLDKPEFANFAERSKEVYLSSAWFKSHWSYQKMLSGFKSMVDETKKYFVCGLPYQLPIKEGLLLREQVEDEMAEEDFNEVMWSINISVLLKPTGPMQKGCVAS